MYALTDADMEAIAEVGRKRNVSPMPPHDGKIAPPFDRLPAQLQESHLWAMKKAMETSRGIDPLSILKVQSAFARRIKDQRFGVPTLVITRAKSASESDPWIESQERLASAGSRGKLVRAVGSGHDIQLEQPQVIVAAVREILASENGNKTTR
jgi:pimeloyl-ACP methyl ester carboxylesterase